jgi:hypothetical protein
MSRSRRKTPMTGVTTAASEKADKAAWRRRHRHAEKMRLDGAGSEYVARSYREHSDPWSMSKDGKRYWGQLLPRLIRK